MSGSFRWENILVRWEEMCDGKEYWIDIFTPTNPALATELLQNSDFLTYLETKVEQQREIESLEDSLCKP